METNAISSEFVHNEIIDIPNLYTQAISKKSHRCYGRISSLTIYNL